MSKANKADIVTSYSQNHEDVYLRAYFHDVKNGFYVDVGANHPVIDSVTNLFYANGWRGINIEPLPNMYSELHRLRKKDINIQAAIGSKKGKATLHVYKTEGDFNGLSTLSKDQESVNDNTERTDILSKEDVEVQTLTLKEVFEKNLDKEQPIHFLKIDVEGLEYDVLRSNDWNRYRPELICIEADHVFSNWKKFIIGKGYILDFFDGINEYYVEKNSKRKLSELYVEHILKKLYVQFPVRTILQRESIEMEQRLNQKITRAKHKNSILNEKSKDQQRRINDLEHQLQRKGTLKYFIVDVPKRISTKFEHAIEKMKKPTVKPNSVESFNATDSLDSLFAKAKKSDAGYQSAFRIPVWRKLLYKVVNKMYRITMRVAKIVYKTCVAIYKRVR
jgi:FkbM family methyltransferase